LPKISETFTVCVVAGAGGSSAVIDLYTRRVPNALSMGVAAAGIAMAVMRASEVDVTHALAGFALGLALMLPGHLIGATGAGDVKLFAALGTWLGPSRIGMAFLYTAIAGGVLAVVVASRRKRLGDTLTRTAELVTSAGANVAAIESTAQNNRFAYVPAIAAGALAAAVGL
jgi:Flp pilus assembly protein protease CpaA